METDLLKLQRNTSTNNKVPLLLFLSLLAELKVVGSVADTRPCRGPRERPMGPAVGPAACAGPNGWVARDAARRGAAVSSARARGIKC